MGRQVPSLVILLLVIANGIGLTDANSYCWDFGDHGPWENTGARNWLWTSDGNLPDTSNIDIVPTGEYVWFQDQAVTPNTGTIVTTPENGITIYPGDVISIDIWRHINYDDGSYRPVLNYNSLGATVHVQPVLWSFNQNEWDTQAITCGPEAEPCCLTYPCVGYFSIDGSVLARDELLGVDNLQVNDGCAFTTTPKPTTTTTTTTTTTKPPPPLDCSCNFDTADLCGWSPSVITTGWIWSNTFPTTEVPASGSDFIYILDTSAQAYSPLITGVIAELTTFSFSYFLREDTVNPNQALVYFRTTNYVTTYFSTGLPANTGTWNTVTFTCAAVSCCGAGVTTCDGTFTVETVNYVGDSQTAAIDSFTVGGAGVC